MLRNFWVFTSNRDQNSTKFADLIAYFRFLQPLCLYVLRLVRVVVLGESQSRSGQVFFLSLSLSQERYHLVFTD